MTNKVASDLEKMKADRRKAEEAYIDSMNRRLEVERITREGIRTQEELILYLQDGIENVKMSEDAARLSNNNIVYCESIAIKREFPKLLSLVMLPEVQGETAEEAHRQSTDGGEAYV